MSDLSKGSSSSQPASSRSRTRRGGRGRGISRYCRCGEAVIRTSGTAKNPGRLFYCCPHGSEGDKYHLFTWTDERIVEEVEDLKVVLRDVQDEVSDLRCEIVRVATQLDQNKAMLEMSAKGGGCCGIL
ncbi:hypothetical protein Bca4012_083286 [Brassica carinata]